MQRINIATPEAAIRFELRASTQRWPRAGVKDVFTAKCPTCGYRHRLTFFNWWLTEKPESQRYMWGMQHGDQYTFESEALPVPVR